MNVLIVYGTTEGQTRKIATFVADRLSATGRGVTLVDATETPPDLQPDAFDAAFVAASLHLGRYQPSIVDFVTRHSAALGSMPTAFISVSLAAASEDRDDIDGLEHCLERFFHETGWTPTRYHHAAGAFRFTQYDFFRRWAMKFIAYRKGVPVDGSRDYELTDWPALGSFVDAFVAAAPAPAGERG